MTADPFLDAWAWSLGVEGEFSDDPADSGGATRWGITEAVARRWGYTGPMDDLPAGLAKSIAKREYWDRLRLDNIHALSPRLAREVFDIGMNMGPGRAGEFLQRALNALNRQQKDYPDVTVDGAIGAATLGALTAFLRVRGKDGETVLLRALNCLQGAFYIQLAEARQKDERFVFGWLMQRIIVEGEG